VEEKKLQKEKLFKKFVPRSRVQLDIVKRLKKELVSSSNSHKYPSKIITYQDIIREDGEYYLLYEGAENLQPLAEYLSKNKIDADYLIKEFQSILELIPFFTDNKHLFSKGINAANYWIDAQKNIYLIPQPFLEIKETYSSIGFDIPSLEYFRPPEIIRNETWNQKSYIFNTAAVFYYFLSGETIFADQDKSKVLNKIKDEKILEIKYLYNYIPRELSDFIMSMLHKEEQKRPGSGEAVNRFENIISGNDLHFEMKSFAERKDLSDNKAVKKKRRFENTKLFFRQRWKVILFFTLIIGGFFYGITSESPSVINKDTEAAEVVGYFYTAVGTKNIALADNAAEIDLGQMERIITESHVVERMQSAFQQNNSGDEIEQVYSLENLKIERRYITENNAAFSADYIFKFRDQENSYRADIEDVIYLEKIDGVWKIINIEGDFADMIDGNYPWRE